MPGLALLFRRFLLQAVFLFFSAALCFAAPLARFNVGALEFRLEELEQSSFRVTLHPKGGISSLKQDLTANVFAISGPSRLVIDVPGFSFSSDKKDVVGHAVIDRVRVGSHPDKTRFVLDLKNEVKPDYTVRTDVDAEAIVISFRIEPGMTAINDVAKNGSLTSNSKPRESALASTSSVSEEKPPRNSETESDSTSEADALLLEAIRVAQESKTADTKDVDVEPEEVSSPTPVDTQRDTGTEAAVDEEPSLQVQDPDTLETDDEMQLASNTSSPSEKAVESFGTVPSKVVEDGQTVVNAISFQSWPADNSNAVVIETSSPGTYQLLPQGEDRYELRLQTAKLGASHLVIPQFPPETFKNFDVVMARQNGDNVVVQIYVTKGVKLYPAKVDGKIWLKTSE